GVLVGGVLDPLYRTVGVVGRHPVEAPAIGLHGQLAVGLIGVAVVLAAQILVADDPPVDVIGPGHLWAKAGTLQGLVARGVVFVGGLHADRAATHEQQPTRVVVQPLGVAERVGDADTVATLVQRIGFAGLGGPGSTGSIGQEVANGGNAVELVVGPGSDIAERVLLGQFATQGVIGVNGGIAECINAADQAAGGIVLVAVHVAVGIAHADQAAGGVVHPTGLRPLPDLGSVGMDHQHAGCQLADGLVAFVVDPGS